MQQETAEHVNSDPLFTEKLAADYLDVAQITLAKWRWVKRGPSYIKIGRNVRYRQSDLNQWLESQTVIVDAA